MDRVVKDMDEMDDGITMEMARNRERWKGLVEATKRL